MKIQVDYQPTIYLPDYWFKDGKVNGIAEWECQHETTTYEVHTRTVVDYYNADSEDVEVEYEKCLSCGEILDD